MTMSRLFFILALTGYAPAYSMDEGKGPRTFYTPSMTTMPAQAEPGTFQLALIMHQQQSASATHHQSATSQQEPSYCKTLWCGGCSSRVRKAAVTGICAGTIAAGGLLWLLTK